MYGRRYASPVIDIGLIEILAPTFHKMSMSDRRDHLTFEAFVTLTTNRNHASRTVCETLSHSQGDPSSIAGRLCMALLSIYIPLQFSNATKTFGGRADMISLLQTKAPKAPQCTAPLDAGQTIRCLRSPSISWSTQAPRLPTSHHLHPQPVSASRKHLKASSQESSLTLLKTEVCAQLA